MYVEFEQVEEGVGNVFEGAIERLLDAEEELQGATGFGARGKGNILKLTGGIGYLCGAESVRCISKCVSGKEVF